MIPYLKPHVLRACVIVYDARTGMALAAGDSPTNRGVWVRISFVFAIIVVYY
jgi:hypothetical protein